ncbi:YihY/virulence factor BrkB family protein [Mycoplasmatota bacterium zrk1]
MKLLEIIKKFNKSLPKYDITLLSASVSFFIIWAAIPMIYLMFQLIITSRLIPVIQFLDYIDENVPSFISEYIHDFFESTSILDGFLLVSFVFLMLWGASMAFNSIMQTAEIIYHEKKKRNPFITRLISLIITLGFIIVFIILIGLSFVTNDYLRNLLSDLPSILVVYNYIKFLGFPLVILILLIFILTFIVPYRTRFRNQFYGAIFITLGWYIFSTLFLIYVRDIADYQSKFGPFSSVIALFIWVFVLSYILHLGIIINASINRKKIQG